MIHARPRCSFSGAVALFAAAAVAQTTVNVPCAADNTLYESIFGDASNGAGNTVFIGLNAFGSIRRAVLRFDVAAHVPAGAEVLAARLQMRVNKAHPSATQPVAINGHRLSVSWGEGTSSTTGSGGGGGGALASVGDATWLHRFWSSTFWTTPGGDFAPAPSFTASMPTLGTFTSQYSRAAAADVQAWLDAPATNFGWLLRTNEVASLTARRLDSREATAVGNRPTLIVTYLLPGQNGTWGAGCSGGPGNLTAAWGAAPIGGTSVPIVKTNAPGSSVGADFFALALDPSGTPLGGGCTAYLPLAEILPGAAFATSPSGTATSSLLLPAGFPGYLINCQAVVLANTPLGFVVSNAAVTVLQ